MQHETSQLWMMPTVDECEGLVQEDASKQLTHYVKWHNAYVISAVQMVTFAFP